MTVATGVVTATILFSKELNAAARYWALASWILFFVSVFFGVAVLFNISGSLNSAAKSSGLPSIEDKGIRVLSVLQYSTFLLGIPPLVVFGFLAVHVKTGDEAPKTPISITCVVPPQPPAPAPGASGSRK